MKDKELWKKYSKNAIEIVKKFNFELAASGIIQAVEYALAN
jgi:hypothetical protein